MTDFIRNIESAKEYRELTKAAERLGFKPVEYYYGGDWKTKNGLSVFARDAETRKVGHKYFTAKLDGEWVKIRPSEYDPDAHVSVTFSDDKRRW